MTWDATKPANGTSLSSAELRNNWDALQASLAGVNVAPDGTFKLWPAGDSAAPHFWTLAGTGATVARIGTGLADTNRKVGDFAAKVTSGGLAAATFDMTLIASGTEATRASYLRGQAVSVGAWVHTATAAAVRLSLNDAVGSGFSAFHGGGSVWSWLTATRVLDASANGLGVRLDVAAGTIAARISGVCVVIGAVPPAYYQPFAPQWMSYNLPARIPTGGGNVTTGTDKERIWPIAPGIVRDVQLNVGTAPASQALIVDVNTWDGAAFTSMFSTRPQVAATLLRGGAQPDSTYARRCVRPYFGSASPAAGAAISVDVDQVGSGTPGANLDVRIIVETYRRPLLEFLEHV